MQKVRAFTLGIPLLSRWRQCSLAASFCFRESLVWIRESVSVCKRYPLLIWNVGASIPRLTFAFTLDVQPGMALCWRLKICKRLGSSVSASFCFRDGVSPKTWRGSDEGSLRIWRETPNCGRWGLVVRVCVCVCMCVCVCLVSRLTFVYSFEWRKADFYDAMKLVLCIAFVNLNTWKCTWVCPVSLVNGVLSHYCTCLKGYLAIVVLGRTGAAGVLTHFRTYFRCQEKTKTCLCQRSSIVFFSVEERVITCACVRRGATAFL